MTSNVGTRDVKLGGKIGFAEDNPASENEHVKATIEDSIKRLFNPEFINRIDDFIIFKKLEKEHIYDIIDIQLRQLKNRLKVNHIEIELKDSAKDFIVSKGFEEKYGARPLRRAMQKYVEDELAEMLLNGTLKIGTKVIADKAPDDEKLIYELMEDEIVIPEEVLPDLSALNLEESSLSNEMEAPKPDLNNVN